MPNAAGKVKKGKDTSRQSTRTMRRLPAFDRTGLITQLRAQGWVPNYCRLIAQREN